MLSLVNSIRLLLSSFVECYTYNIARKTAFTMLRFRPKSSKKLLAFTMEKSHEIFLEQMFFH